MIHSILKGGAKVRRIAPDAAAPTVYTLAAGTSDVFTEIVDMQNFTGILIIVALGTIAASGAVTTKVQQGQIAAMSDAADIATSAIGPTADTDDNKLIMTELIRPTERYVRMSIVRADAANSTIDSVTVILFGARKSPVAADATVYSQEIIAGPTEGTA